MKKISTGLVVLGLLSATFAAHAAATIAYAAVDGGDFGTLDLTTGVYTNLIDLSPSGTVAGLADISGTLYGATFMGNTLYTINPNTGAETLVGTSTIVGTSTTLSFWDFGSTTTGIYATDSSGNLYSINATNAAATKIGNVGFTIPGYSSLSDNSAALYFVYGGSQQSNVGTLYTVNTTNAALTQLGSLTGDKSMLTTINGTLYGVSNVIYTFNTSTDTQSMGAVVTGESGGEVYGLAPDPITAVNPVPLPRSALLLFSGVAFLILAFGRRRRPGGDLGLQAAWCASGG